MKVYFTKRPECLLPIHDSDRDNFAKISNDSVFMKDFKRVRNPEFHRLVFNLLNEVFQFQGEFDDFEAFRRRIKLLSGCYEEHAIIDSKGKAKIALELLSWEFGKMDEYSFRSLFEKIKTACAHHFCKTNEHFELINNYD
jgi:uncharacterized protein DUF1367